MFSSSSSNQNRAFSCKQILVFRDKDPETYNCVDPKIIHIPFYGERPNEEYKFWNESLYGIMDYLIGDEYNMIRMSRGPRIKPLDDGKGFQKKVNYGEIFYFAGLHYFKLGKISTAEDAWLHAILNGFKDDQYVEQLKEENPEAWKLFIEVVKKF